MQHGAMNPQAPRSRSDPALDSIAVWVAGGVPTVIVRVRSTKGSAPRDAGAFMAVTADAATGTIGGGQLEWLAIARAREILGGKSALGEADFALGPELGQCCGGRSRLGFEMLDAAMLPHLQSERAAEQSAHPLVHVFGAGHTGLALARALAPLPVRCILIDTRSLALAGVEGETVHAAMPEDIVRSAPAGSAFVAMTHEHHLDFLVMAEALARRDAAYCGMIGSKTKRAVFAHWLANAGHPVTLAERLTCPIGGDAVRDKRPETIAALTAAEILVAFHSPTRKGVE
jgi:xanthine dehydrogenase accessory factor